MPNLPAWLAVLLVALVPPAVALSEADQPTDEVLENGNKKSDSPNSLKNKIGMTLVRIRAGDFTMGSTKDEQDAVLKSVEQTSPILECGQVPARHHGWRCPCLIVN